MNNQIPLEIVKNFFPFVCSNCGCKKFIHTLEIKYLSPILSPNGQEAYVPDAMSVVCLDCRKEISSPTTSQSKFPARPVSHTETEEKSKSNIVGIEDFKKKE